MKTHCELLARYNQWANRRLYDAAATLSEDQLWQDKGAFFGSLMGTLNHILVADRLWIARLAGEAPPALGLDSVLCDDLVGLRQARAAEDERLLDFVLALDERKLANGVAYANFRGERHQQPLGQLLLHVFNHQTHHRGQAHALVSQLGGVPPEMDLVYFIRERANAADSRSAAG